ncbi:MAG: alpha-2-macroglobulin family protein, partial [Chloroflexota bacterium]
VFDDRQMYRPGEEVHIKGWLRNIGGGQTGDISLVGKSVSAVNYQLFGPQGNEISTGSIAVNALGGFDFMLSLPENANLGYAQLQITADSSLSILSGTHHTHSFQIQEFRRPEFEVSARNESAGPYFAGDHAVVAVNAKYFAGGPLPGAETTWWVTSSPTNYQPPSWPDFNFGTWIPWWSYSQPDYQESGGTSYSGKTDAGGTHFLNLDFTAQGQTRPISIIAEATVMDLNRQAWSSKTSLMVHPADLYIGLRSQSYFVERGTPLEIEIIVTDIDGNLVPDRPITVKAARLQWTSKGGWHEEEVETQTCQTGSTSKPIACIFKTPIGGTYRITATITDEKGRSNQTQITRWVSGGQLTPSREVEQEQVTLIPDQKTYQPGETAQILIQSPFSPAEGMLTVSRSGILYTKRFTIVEGSHTLQIPIENAHIPNIHIQVDVVGSAPRTDDAGQIVENIPPRPAYAIGQLNLSIPPLERTLSLETDLRDLEIGPGEETTLSINLKDNQGQPVSNAELAIVVVDEAILALTNYHLSNPLDSFYTQRSSELSSVYGRSSIILSDPRALADAARSGAELTLQSADSLEKNMVGAEALMEMPVAAPEMEMMKGDHAGADNSGTPIRIRSDFNPLATFAAEVNTDSNGSAIVEIKLPDNLTRYRVLVVAVDSSGKQFGLDEANLTARLPLMVRPSAPRYLNFGDQFELPVMLQNQTDQAMDVDIVIQASNIKLTDFAGLNVTVPPNDRIEVRFPASTEMAGTARFQIAAVSGNISDAAVVEFPVYTPATTEAFATYGTVDNGAITQPLLPPTAVFPQFGSLEISTSSTALQALTDAVLYLSSYPYECTEQLSSRILGIAALRDVLTAFKADGLPAPEALEVAVQRDIEHLSGIQNWDGGFPYWRRGQDSIPFNTIHVAHALQRAKLKGFDIPEYMQQQLLPYLVDIENHYPHWYSIQTRQTLSAYALYVRTLMGDRDTLKARSLLTDAGPENLSLDAIGWIWQVLVDDPSSKDELDNIRLYINNHAVETAGTANFTIGYDDQSYLLLSSNRRTDAILLDALIADKPQHDLIPKLVSGLMAHRVKGHWGNTQENVFVLLALDRYFNTFEAQAPDFVARIWLGNTYAGEHKYQGYTTERHQTNIPMRYIINAADPQDLILSKNGAGRLYYRLGLSYAPKDLNLGPLDMGFVVQRTYEAIDTPEDVYQDNDGAWHIKAGSRVRVRLTMVADNRRYHVALVDPLPAGLEIINPALVVSGSIPQDPDNSDYRYGWWWWSTWYQHQNMRDERAEAFTPLLWDGVYEYTYTTRATTPGIFIAPPAKAEEMYSPEVFGRSSSDWVIVE